ncbi:MAG: hypothetical protein BroJett025_04140 [Patescibacteria group bacterium]|nr:MAG: hypothetical protein BroJett025_04140 [Patescibacteria group bacterium]
MKKILRQEQEERVPVPVPVAVAKKGASASLRRKAWYEQEEKAEAKPWYVERLESKECARFFLDRQHRLRNEAGVDEVIAAWIDVRDTYRALQMFELTDRDVDKLEIPMLPGHLVDRIKAAYKKNKANKNK